MAWNEKNKPPLDADEVFACVESIAKTHMTKTGKAVPETRQSGKRMKEPEGWSTPGDLVTNEQAAPYPTDSLPEVIRDAVLEIVEYVQAPTPLVVQSCLTSLSAAAQAHYDVARDNLLHGPTSLYMLTIAESGARKSAADGHTLSVIEDFEREEGKRTNPLISRFKAEHSSWSKQYQGIEQQIRQLASKGEPISDLESRLVKLSDKEPNRPRKQRLIYRDTTPEALLHELTLWPAGVLTSSEGGSVFGAHGMNKDSAGNYLAKLNELWDGGNVRVDRRQAGSFTLENPRFSLGIMVQKDVLKDFMGKSGQLLRSNGFLSRCLITSALPKWGERPYKEPENGMPAVERLRTTIKGILNTAIDMESGVLNPRLLRLSEEAKKIWTDYNNNTERKMREGEEYDRMRDIASKSPENAARLAALFEVAGSRHTCHEVSAESMAQGVAVAGWYLNESKRFLSSIALPEELQDADDLQAWLIARLKGTGGNRIKRNAIRQYGPSSLRSAKRITPAIEELESSGRVVVDARGRTTYVYVNPALLT